MLANMFRKKRRRQFNELNQVSVSEVGPIAKDNGVQLPEAICRQCGLELKEPDLVRCPRCFALVLEHQCGGCGKCSS